MTSQHHCTISKELLKTDIKTKIMQFLMGLNDAYEHLRNNVLSSSDPTMNVNKLFHMIVQIEREGQDATALAINREGQYKSSDQDRRDATKKAKLNKICVYCKEKGHTNILVSS